MPTLSPKMKDKYVDDLLRARPQGPNHPQQKITYVKEELSKDWCYRSCEYKYKYELIPSHPTWGYTAEQIFSRMFARLTFCNKFRPKISAGETFFS